MTIVKEKPAKLKNNGLCAGCGHGVIMRLIQEVLEELGQENNQIRVNGVGCSCTCSAALVKVDNYQCPHGRPAAAATAMKRVLPKVCIYTYQGDGDAYVIGISETLNAAYRNENIVQIVINNSNYGMTGGQMSWTTLPGQSTETCKAGRDCDLTGMPFHFPEMVASSKGFHIAYAARGAVYDIKSINLTKKMLRDAFEAQINGEGYSIVEILSACPTNWHMTPLQCRDRIASVVVEEYPIGVFKARS